MNIHLFSKTFTFMLKPYR